MNKFLLIFFLLPSLLCVGQSSPFQEAYSYYDREVDPNLALYNGPVYTSNFATPNFRTDNCFFEQRYMYSKGNVRFEGQPYYDVDMRYDIYQDALVIYPKTNPSVAIHLQPQNVSEFDFADRHFVNLSRFSQKPQAVNGYYEEAVTGKAVLYIKHKKFSKKTKYGDREVLTFKEEKSFAALHDMVVTAFASEKDLIAIFPENKKTILEFYAVQNRLRKENETEFMRQLFRKINQDL